MKKFLTLLIAAALMLSLAACGNAGKNGAAETGEDTAAAEETKTTAEPADDASAEADDTETVQAQKALLIGNWGFAGVDDERLTFREDGTGTYTGINEKDYTFTYLVSAAQKTYANGEAYVDYMLHIDYNTGEAEDILFNFRGDNAKELVFHNSENGGYSGIINFDVWTKE